MRFAVFLQRFANSYNKNKNGDCQGTLKLIQCALMIARFDRVTQHGLGSTTKWQALGRAIIKLLKKEPLFVHGLSVFLSF
jgi:hypothetical protein